MILRLAFFSMVIVAGLLAFYFLTRKKWNWSGVSGSLTIALTAVFLIPIGMFIWVSYENRLQLINNLDGITLGSQSADLRFLKGDPLLVVDKENQQVLWRYENPINPGNFTDVYLKNDQVIEISFLGKCKFCNQVSGFGVGTHYNDILKRFGEPSDIEDLRNNLRRRINYPEYQVFYLLEKNKVVSQGIYQPSSH